MPPPSTGLEIPYSNTWRSDEWLLTFPGWQDPKDPKNPKANEAYAANFFETVRNAHLRTLYRKQHPGAEKDTAAEDEAVLEAYKQFSKHPRGFELALRKKMTPDGKVVGKWKPLDDAEQKELAGLDCYERYSDVYAYSHEEARILARKDPAKMKAEEFDLQNKLQYQINKYGR